jgi:magnesium transporter
MSDEPEVEQLSADDLREIWSVLSPEDRVDGFRALTREDAEEFFLERQQFGQAMIVLGLPPNQRRSWMRLLAPDDAADVLQEVPAEMRPELLQLLDEPMRREVNALLAYAEDAAGGLMSPRFSRIRPDMSVDEAIKYLRRQTRDLTEIMYYGYVLDNEQHLLGVVSFRDLFAAQGARPVREVMKTSLVTVPEDMDQELVSRVFAEHDLMAVPVLDINGRMKGVVTVDDIVDVVQEEATEDIHKLGGMEALEAPYLQTRFTPMIKKRGGWLAALFVGEMLTASAMAHYEDRIARAVVLALFVPLIISSGGNSGSQACTLVIRAMALGEVKLRDWWRVMRREVVSGAALGGVLSIIGVIRVIGWQYAFHSYGEYYWAIAFTVGISILGVVLWGTLSGSMLPFLLRKLGFDPASASAPFIATLVDVSGLVIYFSVAQILLRGKLL